MEDWVVFMHLLSMCLYKCNIIQTKELEKQRRNRLNTLSELLLATYREKDKRT